MFANRKPSLVFESFESLSSVFKMTGVDLRVPKIIKLYIKTWPPLQSTSRQRIQYLNDKKGVASPNPFFINKIDQF